MPRDVAQRLQDIVEACDKIARHIDGFDAAAFAVDEKTFDAVVRQFEIAGEAVKSLPGGLIAREPGVAWRNIAGFRDVLAHSHFAVDPLVVWDAAANKAPQLRAACLRLLG